MINEYRAFLTAFQEGKQLANSKIWKQRQNLVNHLSAFIGACLVISQAFGYHIADIPADQIDSVVGGVFAAYGIFNTIMTTVTSSKVGIHVPNK